MPLSTCSILAWGVHDPAVSRMRSPVGSLLEALGDLAAQAASAPLRLTAAMLAAGARSTRGVRDAAADTVGRLSGQAVDALLRMILQDEMMDLLLQRMQERGVATRIVERLLDDGTLEQIVSRVAEGPELGRMLALALESDQTQKALAESFESEAAARLIERLACSPGGDRLLALVLASPLPEELVGRLLESDQLWVLVDEIAQSPAVTAAITQQGRGFVEEVAGRARDRSRTADAWLADLVRRRRRTTPSDGAKPAALPESGPS